MKSILVLSNNKIPEILLNESSSVTTISVRAVPAQEGTLKILDWK